MATKFKALYQRRKGRDLFDSWIILKLGELDVARTIKLLEEYCQKVDEQITRALFERNLILKRGHPDFNFDMESLLAVSTEWDFDAAFEMIMSEPLSISLRVSRGREKSLPWRKGSFI